MMIDGSKDKPKKSTTLVSEILPQIIHHPPAPGGPINTILGAGPDDPPPAIPTALFAVSKADDTVFVVDFSS